MSRVFASLLAAALALPVMALGAMIGQQERLLADVPVLSVPVRGADPRDLLLGHYLMAQFDWAWEGEPTGPAGSPIDGGLCVLAGDAAKPRVRFIADWTPGAPAGDDCRLMIAGQGWPAHGGVLARFLPTGLDGGAGRLHLFVPEARAAELERIVGQRPGALTVDLAVHANGMALVKALRLDGKVLGQ
jgi:hypothetical protein